MPPKVFISYRRSDSAMIAGRISDRLVTEFGQDTVFKDSYSILPGQDFRGKIRESVAYSDVVLVIIGPTWLSVTERDDATFRRLDNPDDWVRLEVETGLQRDSALVIPVLVGGASIPSAKDLPPTLRELAYKNAITVRDDPDFRRDMDELIGYLKTLPGFAVLPAPVAMSPSPPAKPEKVVGSSNSQGKQILPSRKVIAGGISGLLVILFAFLALFSEEWRNDMWYKLGFYTATPATVISTTIASTTEIPTVTINLSATNTPAPTATDVPPDPTTQTPPTIAPVPTSAPVGNANLRLLVDTASFTLVVRAETVNLNGLQFAVTENGSTKIVALADYFDVLALTGGIAQSGSCFVLNRPDTSPAPSLATACTRSDLVYRPNIALADVFWFDFVGGGERDIAIYRDGVSTGQICPAASTACEISFGVVAAAVPTKGYPCDGMMAGSGEIILNVVHEFPNPGSNVIAANSVRGGSSVRLLDDATNSGDIWYEIEQQGFRLGWIPDEYVVISGNCPG